MDNLLLIGIVSIICSVVIVLCGSVVCSIFEARIAVEAVKAICQQPDKSEEIQKTLFTSMAMVESGSIYCLVISMILIFANPFWGAILQRLK